MYISQKNKILVVSLFVLLSFISIPNKARAQYVDVAQVAKEIGDTITYATMQQILNQLTASTVNWINSGFKGKPSYVTDSGQFFLDIADNVVSYELSNTGLSRLCSPFRAQVRLALAKTYMNRNQSYSCSLGVLEQNFESFINNFDEGGWDAWFAVTQNDSGNPYGSYIEAQSQIDRKIDEQVQKYNKQLDWGRGVFSFERCMPGTKMSQAQIDNGEDYGGVGVGNCQPWDKETVTPGTVIDNQLSEALGSSWKRLQAADEINEIIGALVSQFTNKIISGVGGLLGSGSDSRDLGNTSESRGDSGVENTSIPDPASFIPAGFIQAGSGGAPNGSITKQQCIDNCNAGAANGLDPDSCIAAACNF